MIPRKIIELGEQKMESKDPQNSQRAQENSICSQLNLDISRLDDPILLENPTYLRLYSIIKNDVPKGDLSFRKNLIKELYFLLQITPIIRPELKQQFLEEVEKMYNLHDHKKIDLASSKLNNLLSIVHSKKESTHQGAGRPKSGVTWNKNVPSFLRPYTATRPNASKTNRPQSSKFNCQSTKVSTREDIYIREFTTNIQEQLEISKDFIQKHRTNHPQYEPVYEQLYNILKTVQSRPLEQPTRYKPAPKTIKYPRSAITRHKDNHWIKESMQRQSEHLNNEQHQDQDIPVQREETNKQEKGSDGQSSQEQEYLYVNEEKKNPYKPYANVIKIQEQQPEKKDRSEHLKKYSHIVDMKCVQAARQDQQMAEKYVHYARIKSALKRQMSRKNESKRLLSAKPSHSSVLKYIKIAPNQKQNEQKQNVFDLSRDPLALPSDLTTDIPTYNRRAFLKELYEAPVKQFKKRNIVGYRSAEFKPQTLQRPLTSHIRFHTTQKFDPLSQQNVKQYNEDILEEIEKIKSKLGGVSYASTQTLMKALAVVDPSHEDPLGWQNKNPCYNMVSQGRKKLKRKTRKGLKSQKKKLNMGR